MITWIQEKLHKHLRSIFIVLLAIIITSFVFTVGRSPGIGRAHQEVKPLDYYGYNLRSAKDMEFLQTAALISCQMNSGMPPSNEEQLATLIQMRPPLLHLADKWLIPAPSSNQLNAFLATRPFFTNKDGDFEPKRYEDFVERFGKDKERLLQIFEQDYRMHLVQKLLEGPGYTLDYEAQRILEIARTRWTVEEAKLDETHWTTDISKEPAALEGYYKQNKARYIEPKTLQLSSVRFGIGAKIETLPEPDQEKIEACRQKLFNGNKDLKDELLVYFIRREEAKKITQELACGLEYALFDAHIAYQSDPFKQLLSDRGLTLEAPVSVREGEPMEDFSYLQADAVATLFDLDNQHYCSSPLFTGDAYVLFFLDGQQEQRPLSLEEAQARIEADYVAEEKLKAFQTYGTAIREDLVAQLQAGANASFGALAQEKGFVVTTHKDFNLEEPPAGLTYSSFEHLQKMPAKAVSDFFVEGKNGRLLYVEEKILPVPSEHKEALQRIHDYQESSASRLRSIALLRQLAKPALED